MFSSGNVSEKIRVSKFDCSGETVVDLYAGVGYFTLPYLVHCKAKMVHACEWNPEAVEGLRRGLEANGVAERCVVHVGDCREFPLHGIADRVNLGLVPSSEGGWPVACAALKSTTGGWVHIHGNVSTRSSGCYGDGYGVECNPWEVKKDDVEKFGTVESVSKCVQNTGDHVSCLSDHVTKLNVDVQELVGFEPSSTSELERSEKQPNEKMEMVDVLSKREAWQEWGQYVVEKIHELLDEKNNLEDVGKVWCVRLAHIEHVKSYAPHVDHLIADIECRPVKD